MSLHQLLSTTTNCEDNGIFIRLDRDNIHLLRGLVRDKVSSYIETKVEEESNPQIIFKRYNNLLLISVEVYSGGLVEVISCSTIDDTWAEMIVDAFENIHSHIIYQGSCFSDY